MLFTARIIVGLALVSALGPAQDALTGVNAEDTRAVVLDAYLTARADLGQWNGTALVADGGTVLVHKGYGLADIELGVPATERTRYRVASLTKQLTAMAILILRERELLETTDAVGDLLDDVPAIWKEISIHQLLRHTSGIPDYEEWFGGYDTLAYADYMAVSGAPARILSDAAGKALDFEPGEGFRYSNTGYVLLGRIIEAVSGRPYEDFVAQEIFEPLGMRASLQDRHQRIVNHRARGYARGPGVSGREVYNGITREHLVNAHYQRMEPPQADAGLVTTAADLYRWDQALYGESLVSTASLDAMFEPGESGYAYGWFVRRTSAGAVHSHTGGLPGFSALIVRTPQRRATIILLSNFQFMFPGLRQDVAAILEGRVPETPRSRGLVPFDPARHEKYLGTYRNPDGRTVTVARAGDDLEMASPGRYSATMYAESETTFLVPLANEGTATFSLDPDGAIRFELVDDSGRVHEQGVKVGGIYPVHPLRLEPPSVRAARRSVQRPL